MPVAYVASSAGADYKSVSAAVVSGTAVNTNCAATAFTPTAGDVIQIAACTDLTSTVPQSISDSTGKLTWQPVNTCDGTTSGTCAKQWVAQVPSTGWTAGTSVTVTVVVSNTTTTARHVILLRCRISGGQLATTPAAHNKQASATSTDTIPATTIGALVVSATSDFNGTTAASAYAGGATEAIKSQQAAVSGYLAYQSVSATGSNTYGMTAPTGQSPSMMAVEIIPAGTVAAAAPPRPVSVARQAVNRSYTW